MYVLFCKEQSLFLQKITESKGILHVNSTYLNGFSVPVFWIAPMTVMPTLYSSDTVNRAMEKNVRTLRNVYMVNEIKSTKPVATTIPVFFRQRQ